MRGTLVALVASVLLVTFGGAAHAEGTVESGWWTSAPAALAPDAPQDGLVVQGGPDPTTPFAFAAVRFTGASGEKAVSLTLKVAPGAASNPNTALVACPVSGSFTPAQGGAMADAPKFDCSAAKAPGTLAADGSSYAFTLEQLASSGGETTIAIVPTTPTDRVVLARPGADAFQTATADTSTSSDSSSGATADSGSSASSSGDAGTPVGDTGAAAATGSFGAASTPLPAVSDSGGTATDASPSPTAASVASPGAPAPAAAATDTGAATNATTAPDAVAASAVDHGSTSKLPAVGFLVLILLAGSLWHLAGQTRDAPIDGEAVPIGGETVPAAD
jgi:hypothetical protein